MRPLFLKSIARDLRNLNIFSNLFKFDTEILIKVYFSVNNKKNLKTIPSIEQNSLILKHLLALHFHTWTFIIFWTMAVLLGDGLQAEWKREGILTFLADISDFL